MRRIGFPCQRSFNAAKVLSAAALGTEGRARLLHEAEEQALTVIRGNRQALERLIGLLEQHETLHRQQIEQCLGPAARKASIEVVPR